jgi:hypothetical protein
MARLIGSDKFGQAVTIRARSSRLVLAAVQAASVVAVTSLLVALASLDSYVRNAEVEDSALPLDSFSPLD